MKKLVTWRCKVDFWDVKPELKDVFESPYMLGRDKLYLRFQKGEIRILDEFELPDACAHWERVVL